MRLFHAARVIVGPHGPLFANIIYARSDARIIEYCAISRRSVSFLIKRKLDCDYRQHCVPAGDLVYLEIPLSRLSGELADI